MSETPHPQIHSHTLSFGSGLCNLKLIHPKRGFAFGRSSLPACLPHNHTGTRASMGGEAGWQQTLSCGEVALSEALGPIFTTKSHLGLLGGPPAPHGNSTALEAAVPLSVSQHEADNWCMLPAGTGKEVLEEHTGSIPSRISVAAHPFCSMTAAPSASPAGRG